MRKVRESIIISWEINKKKKELKKKECWKWMDDVATQQEPNNNKCYTSTFIYTSFKTVL